MQGILKFMVRHSTLCRWCIGLALLTLLLGSVARAQMMGGSMITFGQIDSGAFGAPAKVTVGLTPASASTVSVQYATRDGTAVAGTDYQATTGTLIFAPGETSKIVYVTALGNGASIYAWLDLSNPVNATISPDPPTAKVPFMGGDIGGGSPLTVQFVQTGTLLGSAQYSASEGAGSLPVLVQISSMPSSAVTVPWTSGPTGPNGATGSDYSPTFGSLTFLPGGPLTQPINLTIKDNGICGGDKAFQMTLGSGTGYTVGSPSQATVTIVDDDPPPASKTGAEVRPPAVNEQAAHRFQ